MIAKYLMLVSCIALTVIAFTDPRNEKANIFIAIITATLAVSTIIAAATGQI